MKLNVDDLVEQGLVKKKTYTEGKYKGLSVLKYSRKVFYDNMWIDKRLRECRGTVVDEDDNIIVMPFTKEFNYLENGTCSFMDPDAVVVAPVKVNGFLGVATMTPEYGLIVSTTGTLDSDYALLARKHIEKLNTDKFCSSVTYLFEICDSSDKHIVPEEEGAYLIGMRSTIDGYLYDEKTLDKISMYLGAKRPVVVRAQFYEILNMVKEAKHEGFMIRNSVTNDVLCKIKTPHYLATKAFLRMGKNRTNLMFNNPYEFKKQIDEEFYNFHQYLLDNFTAEEYSGLHQEERRKLIEEYFNGKCK